MAKESVFKKKERVRPPRVNITYEVETGGAMVMKELPFVMGIMAELSGNPKEALSVELEFNKLADFSPAEVAKQVDPLNELLQIRNKLKDLLSRTEGNDRLEEMLNAIIDNPEMREKLGGTLGLSDGGGDAGGDAAAEAGAGEAGESGETPDQE